MPSQVRFFFSPQMKNPNSALRDSATILCRSKLNPDLKALGQFHSKSVLQIDSKGFNVFHIRSSQKTCIPYIILMHAHVFPTALYDKYAIKNKTHKPVLKYLIWQKKYEMYCCCYIWRIFKFATF